MTLLVASIFLDTSIVIDSLGLSLSYSHIRMRGKRTVGTSQSKALPIFAAMGFSTLITLATFLPLFFRFGYTSPVPQIADTSRPFASYPDPAPSYGNNSWIHDPSIIYEDGTYWRFSTSGNIAIATAPSIKGPWTYKGALLAQGTKIIIASNQDIWVITPHLAMRYV